MTRSQLQEVLHYKVLSDPDVTCLIEAVWVRLTTKICILPGQKKAFGRKELGLMETVVSDQARAALGSPHRRMV